MKPPDKIYIPIRFKDTGRLAPAWWQEPIEGYTNIEYIRKEALLEWAKDKLDKSVTQLVQLAMKSVIDKINSL